MELNKYQTPLNDELKNTLPKEVWDDLIEFIATVPFIKNLIAVEEERGFAKDRPRFSSLDVDDSSNYYNDNRIIVDITKPHILEDMDFFREKALFFDKNGRYTNITPNPNLKSEYTMFWKEELRRWKYGIVRPSDGEWIPGSLYFYWNYTPIALVKKDPITGKGERIKSFPNPWLGDYLFFHYVEQAQIRGSHGKLLKTRGIGFSFKSGAMSPRNMYILPGSRNPNFHLASDKTFLTGDRGVYGKVIDCLDWIADHTPFPKIRIQDGKKEMVIQLGFTDEYGIRRGLLSSVTGISLKDNPDKARGIRGPFIQYEEDGLFKNLEKAWNVNRKAVEDGGVTSGFMLAGGCLTKNNKVWTRKGNLLPINEITKTDGIVGYDGEGAYKEDIGWFKEPEKKECVKITTSGGETIECSTDHPVLISKNHWRKRKSVKGVVTVLGKFCEAKLAGDIKCGDQILSVDYIPIFGKKNIVDARLYGLMIGDGNMSRKAKPSLSIGDDDIYDYINDKYLVKSSKKYIQKSGKIYRQVYFNKMSNDIFEKSTLKGLVKEYKRYPTNIHEYNKKSLAKLIGGYYDADGSIKYDIKHNSIRITLTSKYRSLLEETRNQLYKFGIHGKIVKEYRKGGFKPGRIYRLYITSYTDIIRFRKNIPILCKHKSEVLKKINLLSKIDRTRVEKYYFKVNDNLKGGFFQKRNLPLLNTRHASVSKVELVGEKTVFNLHTLYSNTYLAGNIITFQTGGTEGANFEGSEKLFYKPTAYNIYGVPNVYDKNINGQSKCGFFWGAYLNRNQCYDLKTGEPDVIRALVEVLEDRFIVKYSSSDTLAITQKKAEECITPQEAVMRTEGTVFPVAELKEYLESISPKLENFTAEHYVGDLIYNTSGHVIWKPNPNLHPLRSYDVSVGDRTGAIEIFEMPKKNNVGHIIKGRYIGGIDPIDADVGPSLFSVLIMDTFTDRIVAEYSGRPRTANEAYELCLKLLKFYNAEANYESNLKGLFSYFSNKNALHYLCDVPQILKDMELVKETNLYGNRAKGTRAAARINSWGRILQADWMRTKAYSNNPDDERLNLHRLRGVAYIEEAIKWNSDGNFDRVSAGIMLFILRAERFKRIEYAKNTQFEQVQSLANDTYFTRNYKKGFSPASELMNKLNEEYIK